VVYGFSCRGGTRCLVLQVERGFEPLFSPLVFDSYRGDLSEHFGIC
jgi:hypothetical protein